jgi:hypothetical protein
MTRDNDMIRRLEEYLEEYDGTTPLPGRVRDAIHAALPRTRQAPAYRGPMGVLTMVSRSSAAWLGVAAAAIVAAVVLGAAFLGRADGPAVGGPAPTSTPAPTATPAAETVSLSSAPAAACFPEATTGDCLAPGTYTLTGVNWPAEISLEVPAGWFTYFPGAGHEGVLVDSGPDAPGGSGWGLMFSTIDSVRQDPCNVDSRKYDPEEVDTAAELATAIAAWPGFESTEPAEVTVDGVSGLLVEVTSKWNEAVCRGSAIWLTPGGTAVDAYPMVGDPGVRRAAAFRILEIGDQLLVIRTTDFGETSPFEVSQGVALDPTRHAADQVELQAIVDSIRLTPWPAQE